MEDFEGRENQESAGVRWHLCHGEVESVTIIISQRIFCVLKISKPSLFIRILKSIYFSSKNNSYVFSTGNFIKLEKYIIALSSDLSPW